MWWAIWSSATSFNLNFNGILLPEPSLLNRSPSNSHPPATLKGWRVIRAYSETLAAHASRLASFTVMDREARVCPFHPDSANILPLNPRIYPGYIPTMSQICFSFIRWSSLINFPEYIFVTAISWTLPLPQHPNLRTRPWISVKYLKWNLRSDPYKTVSLIPYWT